MNPTLIEYLGFVVAALILGWAIIEISRRYIHLRKEDSKFPDTWVEMDSTFEADLDKPLPDVESDEEEEHIPESSIEVRAQHNGHHSESKKLL